MPHKNPRSLKNPGKKLRPVPKKAGLAQIRKRYPNMQRFYYDLGGNLFGVRTVPPTKANKAWLVKMAGLKKGKKGEEHQVAELELEDGLLKIINFKRSHRWDKVVQENGQLLLRAVLNEAARIAKKEKADIVIETKQEKLAIYYQSFGFKGTEPIEASPQGGLLKKVWRGILKIRKGK